MIDARTRLLALRGLVWGLLVVWLTKYDFFVAGAKVYLHRPLVDAFFPAALQSFPVLVTSYCVPLALAFYALLRNSVPSAGASVLAFCLGSCALLLHQGSYNDASFVTAFWVALIGTWLYRKSARPDPELAARAAFLTQLVIGMLFLGGTIGKLTPGYFDGSVFYGIYFESRDYPTFNIARAHLDAAQLHLLAKLYSWLVLAMEAVLATLPLWPSRPALRFALLALGGLFLLNNLRLLSVVASLGALALVSLWLLTRQHTATPPDRPASRQA